eukprot:Nk52_evm36s96 gene=Nk52_evmTU36s96
MSTAESKMMHLGSSCGRVPGNVQGYEEDCVVPDFDCQTNVDALITSPASPFLSMMIAENQQLETREEVMMKRAALLEESLVESDDDDDEDDMEFTDSDFEDDEDEEDEEEDEEESFCFGMEDNQQADDEDEGMTIPAKAANSGLSKRVGGGTYKSSTPPMGSSEILRKCTRDNAVLNAELDVLIREVSVLKGLVSACRSRFPANNRTAASRKL